MAYISVEKLIACGVNPTQAKQFAEPLKAAMALNDILTTEKQSAFIAQCMIESASFTRLEENLFYTDPKRVASIFKTGFDLDADKIVDPEEIEFAKGYIRKPKALANRAYANRNGNGDEASGDGWNFRGRGLFQLTGRDNYRAASVGVGLSSVYIHRPDMVAEPSDAALTAAWFWRDRGCNRAMDAGDFKQTTRIINGPAMLHAKEREAQYKRCLDAFSFA